MSGSRVAESRKCIYPRAWRASERAPSVDVRTCRGWPSRQAPSWGRSENRPSITAKTWTASPSRKTLKSTQKPSIHQFALRASDSDFHFHQSMRVSSKTFLHVWNSSNHKHDISVPEERSVLPRFFLLSSKIYSIRLQIKLFSPQQHRLLQSRPFISARPGLGARKRYFSVFGISFSINLRSKILCYLR